MRLVIKYGCETWTLSHVDIYIYAFLKISKIFRSVQEKKSGSDSVVIFLLI